MDDAPSTDPAAVAAAYAEAWLAGDADRLRGLLDADVTFAGPMATLTGREDCVAGLVGMAGMLTDIAVGKRFVDGPDVLTWFDLHTTVAPPIPTANWSTVVEGRITAIRVAFDPRPLTGGDPS